MTHSSAGSFPAFLGRALALFFPEVCQVCHAEPASCRENYVCGACRASIAWIEPPYCDCCGLPFPGDITVEFECANCRGQQLHFRAARAAVEFSGAVQHAIHQYKYNHATWFEPFLADLLISRAQPILAAGSWDFIVPVPLHWLKLRQRSFNQARRLAVHLSRATGIPVRNRLLKRVQPTPTQTRLSRTARTENVKRAFAWRSRQRVEGAKVILVDDVMTTGATASACAKLLVQKGAELVDVWTVARNMLK